MEAYSDFAYVYDRFMEETPYDEWCDGIVDNLKKNGITGGLVCELGAGTGEMTRRLNNKGFDMIGIDNSEEMLMVAREKEEDSSILYLCQDMREFELYGTVAAIVSVCDCVNYVLEEDELLQTFRLVNNYLDPNGIFIFDFNTRHKYRDVIGDATIAESDDEASFIWNNFYDEETDINEYDLTFFVHEEDDLYRRFDEIHFQRGYTFEQIKRLIDESGLVFLEAFDADTHGIVSEDSERIVIVAKECGK